MLRSLLSQVPRKNIPPHQALPGAAHTSPTDPFWLPLTIVLTLAKKYSTPKVKPKEHPKGVRCPLGFFHDRNPKARALKGASFERPRRKAQQSRRPSPEFPCQGKKRSKESKKALTCWLPGGSLAPLVVIENILMMDVIHNRKELSI